MSSIRKSSIATPKRTGPAFASPPQHHGPLTGERIAEDLIAFGKAGGKIEILGNTPLRGKAQTAKPTPADPGDKAGQATTAAPPGKA